MDPDDRSELLEQALKCLRVPDDRREDASAWILDAAQLFRERHATDQQGAPRLATLKKQTVTIEKHAAGLARILDDPDPYFVRAAFGYLGVDDWKDDRGNFHISEIADPQERAQLRAKLKNLETLASRLRKALPPDTGGSRDLRHIFEGPVTWSLAADCFDLFDWFRPGKATGHVAGTEKSKPGNYHTFVEIVYELGIEEEPSSGLTHITKRAARVYNAYAERTPGYRRLRGESPVGFLTGSGLAADLYGAPAKLRDE